MILLLCHINHSLLLCLFTLSPLLLQVKSLKDDLQKGDPLFLNVFLSRDDNGVIKIQQHVYSNQFE